MPRDLRTEAGAGQEEGIQGPELTRSPEELPPGALLGGEGEGEEEEEAAIAALSQRNEKRDELHPYTQSLTLSDIESCVRLEEASFPPQERCTREKFQYRLRKCGELCLGIFTSHEENQIITADTSAPVYSGAPQRKAVLLGHIVATKTMNLTVTDDDMDIPTSDPPDPKLGHKEAGRTICIHSLAVLPDYQQRGLGKTLMKAYLHRMESHGVADRVALIAHKELIPYYESFGFENRGESQAQFAGGGWNDMVLELDSGKELSHGEADE